MGKCSATIRFLAWLVNRTPAVKEQLADWNRVIQFSIEGENPFFLTTSGDCMTYGRGPADTPNLLFTSSSGDFFDVIIGKTKFDQGFSAGKYTIKGSITDAVRLMRIAESTLESHPTLATLVKTALRVIF